MTTKTLLKKKGAHAVSTRRLVDFLLERVCQLEIQLNIVEAINTWHTDKIDKVLSAVEQMKSEIGTLPQLRSSSKEKMS